jgi:MOSC domain-containing protein YiiM
MARLVSVNVGAARDVDWVSNGRTAMDKRPVDGPVPVGELGVGGDEVGNPTFHGGVDQAVYAYAREDLDWWAAELGADIDPGQFAENLTTEGLDLNVTTIGTRWRINDVVLEVAAVRIPCGNFSHWMGMNSYDNAAWVKRFTQASRPGPYQRVIQTGPHTNLI